MKGPRPQNHQGPTDFDAGASFWCILSMHAFFSTLTVGINSESTQHDQGLLIKLPKLCKEAEHCVISLAFWGLSRA